MLSTQRASPRTAHHHRLDRAAKVLLRLVTDQRGWEAEQAAGLLRAQLGDDRLIRLLRVRVLEAMQDRPTPVDHRALSTLDHALLEAPAHD